MMSLSQSRINFSSEFGLCWEKLQNQDLLSASATVACICIDLMIVDYDETQDEIGKSGEQLDPWIEVDNLLIFPWWCKRSSEPKEWIRIRITSTMVQLYKLGSWICLYLTNLQNPNFLPKNNNVHDIKVWNNIKIFGYFYYIFEFPRQLLSIAVNGNHENGCMHFHDCRIWHCSLATFFR